jgi:CDP-paratose 2-epimerase
MPGWNDPVLITGGAGFIGANLANRLLDEGHAVILFDNLSRAGVTHNLSWLRERHPRPGALEVVEGDIRDARLVKQVADGCGAVVHLAAQVAVTTSLVDPLGDFDVNARGTLNLLEALRAQKQPPPLLYTSTNKVYGPLEHVKVSCIGPRWAPDDLRLRRLGIDESQPLDFHSPYGCSKGAADQYVLDYARVYGLPAIVFRMSCIYGPHQCGNADQGWVAHFVRSALAGRPLTVYGDGKQVRDTLFVDDLVDAMSAAFAQISSIGGRAYNIGGGVEHTMTLLELLDLLSEVEGLRPEVTFAPWRPADQRYYVSDTRAFQQATGWTPRITVRQGVKRLCEEARERGVAPGAGQAPGEQAWPAAQVGT